MNTVGVKGSVIWRLPGSESIQVLENSEGNDQFIISYFDRTKTPEIIRGQIKDIAVSDIPGFFNRWKPGFANDRTSTLKSDYISWIERAKAEISEGLLSKVVMARRQWYDNSISVHELFKILLKQHKNAFVYAFNIENQAVMIGASPETLLDKKGDILYTEALGGTWTRDDYKDKEILEHSHILQFIESTLSFLGYEYKAEYITSKQAGSVKHLLTPYTALSKGFNIDMELAYQLHPTSAVCGLPFLKAFDFIKKTENFDRRYYSGYLGPINGAIDFSLFVNLRCAEIYDNGMVLYAGAGLNTMSDAEDEWTETSNKMLTIAHWLS